MKHALMIGLSLLTLAAGELTAGVLGKYSIKGTEGPYSFRGILNIKTLSTCSFNVRYNDGDSASVTGRFKTPLKNTTKAQTVNVTWSYYGLKGTGKVTVQGIKGGYATSFTYSGAGVSGRGSGTKKP